MNNDDFAKQEKQWRESMEPEVCERCGVSPKGEGSHYCYGCLEEIRLENSSKGK